MPRDLLDLQATPHAASCFTQARRAGEDGLDVGTTDPEFCTCGLASDLKAAGSVEHRDGPSIRPNWRKGKR